MPTAFTPPVVLGTSFSGLGVSLQLSQAGIRHVLVGGAEPPPTPRLGESMIETTGPELWRLLGPEARSCFFKKNHISLFDGNRVSLIHIGNPHERLEDVAERVVRPKRVGMPFFRTMLMHVDRGALDPLLFRQATSRPECDLVRGFASDIQAGGADRVARITLDDGRVLEQPRAVFDATGFRSVVAQTFGLDPIPLSAPQRVAWGHRIRASAPEHDPHWWQHGTNLVRLTPGIDGVRAIAWVIPLGRRLSLGLSVDADDPAAANLDKGALLDRLIDGCTKRGLDLRTAYPEAAPVEEVRHAYTRRARAFGANWLLVGGTYQQIWFPSSTGVWTSTAAAGLAPRFLDDPIRFGRQYQKALDGLRQTHAHMAHLVYDGFEDDRSLAWFWGRWLAFVPRRMSDYFAIVNDDANERRRVHSMLRRGSHIMLKRPRLHQAAFALSIRIARPSRLDGQADAFPGYFGTRGFRARSFVTGIVRALKPFGRWPEPWTARADGPPTSALGG